MCIRDTTSRTLGPCALAAGALAVAGLGTGTPAVGAVLCSPLPSASGLMSAQVGSTTLSSTSLSGNGVSLGPFGPPLASYGASASVAATPVEPDAEAIAYGPAPNNQLVAASAQLSFYVEECGPSGIAPPPLSITGQTVTSTVGFASWSISSGQYYFSSQQSTSVLVNVAENTPVQLTVNAGAQGVSSFTSFGFADFANIAIDPYAPNAGEFHLRYTNGFTPPAPGVPEPAPALLLATGLFVLLAKGRGRRALAA